MTKVLQNEPTKLQNETPDNIICHEAAFNIFDAVMRWHPLKDAAEIAAGLMIGEMDNADFFTEKYALTERQKDFIKDRILILLRQGADAAVAKQTDFEKNKKDKVGDVVIRELVKIPEQTMAEIGAQINRGALLAMTAVAAKATNDERDEITMWKTKLSGDITIPTRGVFISTNCVENLKKSMNFADKDIDVEVK